MIQTKDDGLPSKLICVRYTLARCMHNPKDAEKLIEQIRETTKRGAVVWEKIRQEAREACQPVCW